MPSRAEKKKRQEARKWAERQYIKHRRHNMVYAEPGVHDFVIVLDNLKPSFNIGKIFRSCDAFGARAIHLVGTEYFDVKSAKGAFKWVPAHFHPTFDECYQMLQAEDYTFYVLEPDAPHSLHRMDMPRKSAFIFGHEEHGISFDKSAYQGIDSIRVPQVGRVESLNVSVAASIVMYEYLRQYEE